MSTTLDYLLKGYWTQYGDPRTTRYFMGDSLTPLLTILSLYSLFVLWLGPRLMANRAAFSLKPLLMAYNLIMSLWNVYFFCNFMLLTNFGLDSLDVVFPSFQDTSPLDMLNISMEHQYLLSKLVDLLDTVFFVLRKKTSQVTWLHLYHHTSTPLFGWIHFRLCARNRMVIPFILLNTIIHTLMYAYYGLAALGPRMRPYLRWKRYITAIQILQFALLSLYSIYFALFQVGFPRFFVYHLILQPTVYMILFGQFYRKTYKRKSAHKET